ncbi:UNVERIFIED_CONTAM: hypothetical protein Sangu_2196400 [Sesamum angustifolium]|uniref:Membrane protein YjcL n=1 Tax=Sesamum angustifolium TaxID=2727405 RepID=A0AAW2LFK6_9LAMI
MVSPDDHWVCGLPFSLPAVLVSEKTKIGSMVSAALVSILVGLAASNLGIIPHDAPAYSVVFKYLLPVTIPLLLFRADLKQVIQTTGTLFLAFFARISVSHCAHAVLGQDNWKIAAALMAKIPAEAAKPLMVRTIRKTKVKRLVLLFYFAHTRKKLHGTKLCSIYAADSSGAVTNESKLSVLQMATALAVSFAICKAGTFLSNSLGILGGELPAVTAIVVFLATLLPSYFRHLAPAGDAFALVLMQVFFAVLGASGSLWSVINTAPGIFLFAFIQVTVHLAVILGLGKLFQIDQKLILLASNANIGGPTTAGGMATAKGWATLVVPGILVGIFGISIATFLGIGFGTLVLRYM